MTVLGSIGFHVLRHDRRGSTWNPVIMSSKRRSYPDSSRVSSSNPTRGAGSIHVSIYMPDLVALNHIHVCVVNHVCIFGLDGHFYMDFRMYIYICLYVCVNICSMEISFLVRATLKTLVQKPVNITP
jgi:hypothetical protein